jgi:predicted nucleic acid-binding protein
VATSDRAPDVLVDTSVAVALLVADHSSHPAVAEALGDRRLGLAGHAAFETYSVLTRLPPPARRTPAAVSRLIETNFPASRYPSPTAVARLMRDAPGLGISGGSMYDALVGISATLHGLPLATRDRSALATYQALGVRVELIS